MMIIEINGKLYRRRPHYKSTYPPYLKELLDVAEVYGGLRLNTTTFPNVNITKEYGLIELKKSKLSRMDRDKVCIRFNQLFELAYEGQYQNETLKNCPYCYSDLINVNSSSSMNMAVVSCMDCGHTLHGRKSEEDLIADWNKLTCKEKL